MVLVGDSLLMTHDTYKLVLSDCVARLWLDYVSCLQMLLAYQLPIEGNCSTLNASVSQAVLNCPQRTVYINHCLSKYSSSHHHGSVENTVDGKNPAPVDMVNLPLFTTGFIHPRWLAWLAGFLNRHQQAPQRLFLQGHHLHFHDERICPAHLVSMPSCKTQGFSLKLRISVINA